MREPSVPLPPIAPALALCLAPAAVISVFMAFVVAVAPTLEPAELRHLFDAALLANVAVWFGFAPAYLFGWVQYWDPAARARTGVLGLGALTGVAWFVNLGAYGVAGSLLAAVLR